jgi:hypothetical protein
LTSLALARANGRVQTAIVWPALVKSCASQSFRQPIVGMNAIAIA